METRRLTVELGLPDGSVHVDMDVPVGEVTMERLLPALRATADALVAFSAARTERAGKRVSCALGCGACCRQLVPLAPAEARRLSRLVDELPGPRRAAVRERFVHAVRRAGEAGLLPLLEGRVPWGEGRAVEVGLAWFRLGIPCPFLEDEACSIYEERPIACREYLVTSPPAACAAPTPESVDAVPLPTRVWAAAAREEQATSDGEPARCVPLVVAPRWVAAHADAEPVRPGPEMLRSVYARFARGRSGEGGSA